MSVQKRRVFPYSWQILFSSYNLLTMTKMRKVSNSLLSVFVLAEAGKKSQMAKVLNSLHVITGLWKCTYESKILLLIVVLIFHSCQFIKMSKSFFPTLDGCLLIAK